MRVVWKAAPSPDTDVPAVARAVFTPFGNLPSYYCGTILTNCHYTISPCLPDALLLRIPDSMRRAVWRPQRALISLSTTMSSNCSESSFRTLHRVIDQIRSTTKKLHVLITSFECSVYVFFLARLMSDILRLIFLF